MPKNEDYIPLAKIPALILKLSGVDIHRDTVYKWTKKGRITPHGECVKLKVSRRIGHLYTTQEWLEDFMRKVG